MGSAIKKLKKSYPKPEIGKANPVNLKLLEQLTYNRGFDEGAKAQREKDIESTVSLLEGLETIPGIGEKLAWKVREHVIKQFGKQEEIK